MCSYSIRHFNFTNIDIGPSLTLAARRPRYRRNGICKEASFATAFLNRTLNRRHLEVSPGPLFLSTSQVSMRLSAEALSAPRYAISKNNLQEKMSRAFPDRGVQQQTDYQRQNRGTIKNIKIAGKMLVNVFDMLGTSSNEVRAVRKWFQQKTNIKYASVTGKLLLLFLRNQTLHSITGKVIAMPNRIVTPTDRLSVLYVLNDLFQRTHKSLAEKTRSRRDSTGDESSNTTRSNTLTHNDGSNMIGVLTIFLMRMTWWDKSMSCKDFFDIATSENVIPAIVGEQKGIIQKT